jgi:hypothetical protein
MVDYKVLPHQGIGPVLLRMSQEDVRRVMGVPRVSLPLRGRLAPEEYYDSFGFKIEYDFDSRVRFIEVGPHNQARFLYSGCSVFETKADDLIRLIDADASIDTSHPEFPTLVVFPSLELALWRRCLPEESGGEDGTYFDTLAIGVSGYFNRTIAYAFRRGNA